LLDESGGKKTLLVRGSKNKPPPKKKTFNYGKENHNTISIDP
jgi:hypothetical protein